MEKNPHRSLESPALGKRWARKSCPKVTLLLKEPGKGRLLATYMVSLSLCTLFNTHRKELKL